MSPLFTQLAQALAAPDQPRATLAALDQALREAVGHRFLSMHVYRRDEGVAERIHSSDPARYPARGRKAFADAPTQKRVAETGQPYIGRDAADIRAGFPDHETIFAMGCESILNMPVCWQGQAIGQVNLLDVAYRYSPEHLPLVQALVQMCIPAFLLAASKETAP
jgi:transcriptional regulator with GAF, ATPase, and Fis domain